MEDSIFYKYAKGIEKPETTVRYEDDELLAFDNLYPDSPVHVVLIPKKSIQSIADMEEGDIELVGKMFYRVKLIAEELGIADVGYKLSFNVKEGGGQTIPYLHLHIEGGFKKK